MIGDFFTKFATLAHGAAHGGDDVGAPVAFFSSFGSLGLLSSQYSVVCEK